MKLSSSWISDIAYRKGYLAIFLKKGGAILYSNVPSYLPGLIQAGKGGVSVGSAYSKLMKGEKGKARQEKYGIRCERVEGEKVNELREMMKGKVG